MAGDRTERRIVRRGDTEIVEVGRLCERVVPNGGQVAPGGMEVPYGHAHAGMDFLLQLHRQLVVVFTVEPAFAGRPIVAQERTGLAEVRVVQGAAFAVGGEVREVALRDE